MHTRVKGSCILGVAGREAAFITGYTIRRVAAAGQAPANSALPHASRPLLPATCTFSGAAPQGSKAAAAEAEDAAGRAEDQGVGAASCRAHDAHAPQLLHHPWQVNLQAGRQAGTGSW